MSFLSELVKRLFSASNKRKLETEANRALGMFRPRVFELVDEAANELRQRASQAEALTHNDSLQQLVFAQIDTLRTRGASELVINALKTAVVMASPGLALRVGNSAATVQSKITAAAERVKQQIANAKVRL